MSDADVPSPIDFHDPVQAKAWEDNTVRGKPWRARFFAAFAQQIHQRFERAVGILELGSGPGHLAEAIFKHCAVARYVALDFSAAMHALARERLESFAPRVEFVTRDFRDAGWSDGLGSVDAVVTLQAAHETRHKRHLNALLREAATRLPTGGLLLYCDHYNEPGSGKNPALYLERDAQLTALEDAGFSGVSRLLDEGGMALYSGVKR